MLELKTKNSLDHSEYHHICMCKLHVSHTIQYLLHVHIRSLVKSVYQKNFFLISQPKHMLWVLKKNRLNEMVKNIFTILRSKNVFI